MVKVKRCMVSLTKTSPIFRAKPKAKRLRVEYMTSNKDANTKSERSN